MATTGILYKEDEAEFLIWATKKGKEKERKSTTDEGLAVDTMITAKMTEHLLAHLSVQVAIATGQRQR